MGKFKKRGKPEKSGVEKTSQEKHQEETPEKITGKKPVKVTNQKSKQKQQNKTIQDSKVKVKKEDTLSTSPSFFQRMSDLLYKYFYIAGVLVIRTFRQQRRRFKKRITRMRGKFFAHIYHFKNFAYRTYRTFRRKLSRPFLQIKDVWDSEQEEMQQCKENKKIPWRSYGKVVKNSIWYIWRIVRAALNYIAPVAAAIVLYVTVRNTLAIPFGLDVTYKGNNLGYVRNEKDFSAAINDVDSRVVSTDDVNFTAGAPLFQIVRITPELVQEVTKKENPNMEDIFTQKTDLANGIIHASGAEITEGYGLYVSGDLIGAVKNGDVVMAEIEKIQDKNKTGKPDERVEFDKPLSYTKGLFPTSSIVPEQTVIDKLYSKEEADEFYKVKAGDTPSGIADKMGIPKSKLYELNPNLEDDFVEGKELYVTKAKPFLSVKNVYTDIYNEEIPYRVIETENVLYAIGYREVERPGVPGYGRVTARITAVDGVETDRRILNVEHLSDPKEELVTVGSRDPRKIEAANKAGGGVSSTGFIWPAQGGFVGTGLGGYYGHTGVDINNSAGPVLASASGTVVKANWSYVGYGNHIVIDHGNGFQTLYAHNTTLYVDVGDFVAQGQAIALLGSTGNSTGPHIHFEVRSGGQIMDPVNYIGSAG